MTAYPYRLPRARRYRRRLRLRRGDTIGLVIGIAVAAGGIGAAPHPHAARHSGHTAAAPVAGTGETAFFRAVLTDLGARPTAADLRSLEAWYPHEYPSWPPGAANDPLDSTLVMPGSWVFNSFACGAGMCHVQSYPSPAEGADATARTLAGGYPLIVAALQSGGGICGDSSVTGELLSWSGGGYGAVGC
jgi:hypothetical protein